MRDLTDVATKEKWTEIVRPKSLLDSCTIDGKIYCAPVNIHSWQWLWLSNKAFEEAGVAGAEELGRVRRRRTGAREGRHRFRSPSAASPGSPPARSTC